MELSNKTLIDIELATRKTFPNEMCGFILTDGEFVHVKNIHPTPEVAFEISICDYHLHQNTIQYIVHSHTKSQAPFDVRTPSIKDLLLYKEYSIPLLICGLNAGVYKAPLEYPKPLDSNYLNRDGVFALQDCGIIVRDFYHFEFNIDLIIKPEWSLVEKSKWGESIQLFIKENNFIKRFDLENMKFGDIFLIDLFGEKGNHGLIYLNAGEVLHQRDTSIIEPLELFKDKFTSYYRHKLC